MAAKVSLKIKGKGSKGTSSSSSPSKLEMVMDWTKDWTKDWSDWSVNKVMNVTYYGFIPLIIIIGMRSDPKPNLFQLLSPV
ncbi:hypothetical protein AALP_AA4G142900 [Arabis alpina]|uniref:Uncharacterized protein n=1 Tax=Arabis alpina TaxID=50452 RepID=A0A087H382_ARAAL|nr:hypothetical protein AALP_AA4G142900 [Arabis alpina]